MVSASGCAPQVVATSSGEEERRGASASRSEPGRPDQSFKPADRIRRSSEFARIYRGGRKLTSQSFVVFVIANEHDLPRLGITVTRKVGTAVVRNRIKRMVREIFRRNRSAFGPGLDWIVNARGAAVDRAYALLEQELLGCASRAGAGRRP